MKKFVVAVDSFKGSLSTFEAGDAVKTGIMRLFSDARIVISPIADGGEGTVDAIVSKNNGEMVQVKVCDPLGREITAEYGVIRNTKTAVMEMASASGITLLTDNERNPLNTTTFGFGQMIKDAVNKGIRRFVIGIGGSATNDGGTGMLQALGFEFLDKDGRAIQKGAKGLKDLVLIKTDKALKELSECEFVVACDVRNPLCGDMGCSRIFGPQKGADDEMIKDMDLWLSSYAELTKTVFPLSDSDYPGTGAAGGMGFALMSYLGAQLKSGIRIVMEETGLEEEIKDADLVITGEGRLDGQSHMGKVPAGVAEIAKKYNKPVIAFSGSVTDDADKLNEYGIDAFFPIVRTPCSLDEAMDKDNASKNLSDTVYQVMRLINTKIL